MYRLFIKRTIDIIGSLIGLVIIVPVLIMPTLLINILSEDSVFFAQSRPGRNKKIFKVIKYRTMNNKKDLDGKYLSDEQRLTKFGKILRKTSIDEMPQLINVLKGDMSLIGPRPLLIQYLPLYSKEQARRHEVKPGITGWAQVNGRNAITWQQKFEYDVWYVDNMSFMLDMKILFLTVKKVFKREGINQEGQATAEAFTGNFNTADHE